MKILVTGASGFIGKNLITALKTYDNLQVLEAKRDTDPFVLEKYCSEADIIYHLAGSNRPKDEDEYELINVGFTKHILELLKREGNRCPVVYSSSIQALLNNPYGRSKKAGEELILDYGKETGVRVYLYRLPNVFGNGCRPNYNSFIATLCYNTINELPTTIDDARHLMRLVYVDDLVMELASLVNAKNRETGFCEVSPIYHVTLGRIAELIWSFRDSTQTGTVPELSDDFSKKLYRTYLSYLPEAAM